METLENLEIETSNTVILETDNMNINNYNNQKHYDTEGNIDFYKLLEDDTPLDYEDTNKCLITYAPLNATSVTLQCNHSFNYLPLYKYVVNSKLKFNNMEYQALKQNQIKCPFCRSVQNELLPHPPPKVRAKLIHGINIIEYSPIKNGVCNYEGCKSTHVNTAFFDNQTYCFSHRGIAKKIWEKAERQKKKDAKETIASNPVEVVLCKYIFTRGEKKGTECGCHIRKNPEVGFCGKHLKYSISPK